MDVKPDTELEVVPHDDDVHNLVLVATATMILAFVALIVCVSIMAFAAYSHLCSVGSHKVHRYGALKAEALGEEEAEEESLA